MNAFLEQHRQQIAELCREYRVERLDVFGSAATGRFDLAQSDFDFIVRFQNPTEPGIAHRYFALAASLEAVLNRPVDLLTDRPFRNPYFAQSVQESRANVYEQGYQEASCFGNHVHTVARRGLTTHRLIERSGEMP